VKYQGEIPPEQSIYTLKNEGWEGKIGLVWE
jgi:hypothetical protein